MIMQTFKTARAVAGLALLAMGAFIADAGAQTPSDTAQLLQRIEQLEAEIDDLQEAVRLLGVIVPDANSFSEDVALPYYLTHSQLEDITFNVAGTNAERFGKVSASLGLMAREGAISREDLAMLHSRVGLYMPKIKAIITDVLRSKFIDELDSDIASVQKEMAKRLNEEVFAKLFPGKRKFYVSEVLFTEIFLQ